MNGVALITGAASGIGRATALAFADEGCTRLILADLNSDGLSSLSSDLKAFDSSIQTVIVKTDTSKEEDVQRMVDEGVKAFGSIHYCVNCAGITSRPRLRTHELPIEAWDRVIGINLRGVYLCERAQITQMLKQEPQAQSEMRSKGEPERGSIVNISSVLGRTANPTSGSYSAAKHGVLGLSRTDAAAYGCDGIRVNSVCPGIIYTPLMEQSLAAGSNYDKMLEGVPISRFGKPEEVAQVCIWLASTRSSYVTGEEIVVDGGLIHTM